MKQVSRGKKQDTTIENVQLKRSLEVSDTTTDAMENLSLLKKWL